MRLRALGFCGVDNSVNPAHLLRLSESFPWIEWGILFRPGYEGRPRYPSQEWLEQLISRRRNSVSGSQTMRLAAHFCGDALNELLRGDLSFASKLARQGFGRIQLNATAINGALVPDSGAAQFEQALRSDDPSVEWILQYNDETSSLWEPLLAQKADADVRTNVPQATNQFSVLFDASAGRGETPVSFPEIDQRANCGFAGGIGPHNIKAVLKNLEDGPAAHSEIWLDMETHIRDSSANADIFSLDKVQMCIAAVMESRCSIATDAGYSHYHHSRSSL